MSLGNLKTKLIFWMRQFSWNILETQTALAVAILIHHYTKVQSRTNAEKRECQIRTKKYSTQQATQKQLL